MKLFKLLPVFLILLMALSLVPASAQYDDVLTAVPCRAGETECAPLEISFMNYGWGTPPPPDTQFQKFIEEKLNVRLNPIWVPPSELANRVNLALASNDLPAITQLNDAQTFLFTSQQAQAARDGLFHDLTPYIEDPDFATKYPNLAQIPQEVWDNARFNGRLYVIPRHLAPLSFSGVTIRKDLFDAAGFTELPTTLEEYTEMITAISQQFGVYGLQLHTDNFDSHGPREFANAITGQQDWRLTDDGELIWRTSLPEYKEFLNWLRDLYAKGVIHPEFMLGQNTSDWLDGRSASTSFRWHAYIPTQAGPGGAPTDIAPEGVEFLLIPPLRGPRAWMVEANTGHWTKTVISSAVPVEDVPRMLAFLDVISQPEWFNNVVRCGIEGVHSEIVDGECVTNETYEAEGVGAWGWFGTINNGASIQKWIDDARRYGATEEELAWMEDVVGQIYAAYADSPGIQIPIFNLVSPTYVQEWDTLMADMNANRVRYVVGAMDEAEWDAYIQGIVNSDTFKQIVAEFQASLNS
jgi:putative aldouronate transport system substrate-binding protein